MDGQVGAGERIRELVKTGMPIILYDNDIPGLLVDRVLVENKAASFRAVSHLLDIGHTRIAVLTGDADTFTGRQRFEGYREALLSRGLPIDERYVLDTHWHENDAYSGMLHLLSLFL